MGVILANNATGKLSSAITASATSISLQSGNGAAFPLPAANEWFPMTLIKATGELEIIKCTHRSDDTFTVVRAQEGTVGLSFNAGDRVSCRFTALTYAEKQNRITLLDGLSKDATAQKFRDAVGAAPIDSPEFTGYLVVPTWTTATRPDNASGKKMIGYNSDLKSLEGFINGKWGGVGGDVAGGFSFRNKIVDGRFDFWHEGTSQTTSGYGSDTMWLNLHSGTTKVHSQQALVAGVDLPAIEVPTAKYFSRTVVTSVAGVNNLVAKVTKIEDVGTLAGKTATLSFYAKADAVKNITAYFSQQFGTGGSTAVDGIGGQLISLSTVWKRYSVQVTFPSITGKIIGTGNAIALTFGFDLGSGLTQMPNSCGQQSGTFDIACVQLEEGSVATPFEELPIEVSQKRIERYYEEGIHDKYIGYNANTTGYISGLVLYRTVKRSTPVIYFWGDSIRGTLQNKVQLTDAPSFSSNTLISGRSDSTFLHVIHTEGTEPRVMLRFCYVVDARL